MTAPTIVITDHAGGTSTTTIEVGHAAHFECVSASTIGSGDWYQSRIEWSVNDTGQPYINGIRGFNFSHYFQTAGSYTVTCVVTNVAGERTVTTRAVTVSASTRSTVTVNDGDNLKTVHDANSGSNKEFVITGTVTCNGSIAPGSNNVFRSATSGVQAHVQWTGAAGGSFFNLGSVDAVTWKDLHITQGGANRSVSVMQFAGTNNNVIDCTVDKGVCSGQMLNCASDPRGVLIRNTYTTHDSAGQNIWMGNTKLSSRMAAVYGGRHVADVDNGERASRGAGQYISLVDSYFEQQNVSNEKEPISINACEYYYLFRTEVHNSTASGTGGLMLCGHTSLTVEVAQIVIDRCKMWFSARIGTWTIGASSSSCDKLMVRNCVFRNVSWNHGNVTNVRAHHNTWYNSAGSARWILIGSVTAGTITATGNLCVWGSSPTESILVTTTTDTANEFTLISNNVTGTITQEDVDINDAVNGNKDEQYATFNARANADGNLRKTVAINAVTAQPLDTADTDIIFTPHSDLAIFPEDHYGNTRPATWLAGAVDRVSPKLFITVGNTFLAVSL